MEKKYRTNKKIFIKLNSLCSNYPLEFSFFLCCLVCVCVCVCVCVWVCGMRVCVCRVCGCALITDND